MFEVVDRDGMARAGKWKNEEYEITTPALLFVSNPRIKVPEEADALLTTEKLEGKNSVVIPEYGLLAKNNKDGNLGFVELDVNVLNDIVPKELNVINNCITLLKDHRMFIQFIISLRERIGNQRLIFAPGIAAPWNIGLLTYAGIDLLDSSRIILETRMGNFLTTAGKLKKESGKICFCKGCQSGNGYDSLLLHNYYATIEELELVKQFIKERRLRELVEMRAPVNEWALGVLKHIDFRYYEFQEQYFPVSAQPSQRLRAYSSFSLHRPDIVRFRRRVEDRYKKPEGAEILLLIPCSAKKPYYLSKTHRRINRALSSIPNRNLLHLVVVTSPLGLVPKELELFYPARHYDIPVTGDWSADEKSMLMEALKNFLERNKYEHMIAHLGSEEPAVKEIMDRLGHEVQYTALDGHATSKDSLENLRNVTMELIKDREPLPRYQRIMENMKSIVKFQFGAPGDELLTGSEIKGSYPRLRIMKNDTQLAILSSERGMLSLSLEGARIIAEKGFKVEIEDFQPQSTVFAVGVTSASDEIRIGDEVAIVHDNDVRGVGVAAMSPKEMVESDRGVAVKVRHHT